MVCFYINFYILFGFNIRGFIVNNIDVIEKNKKLMEFFVEFINTANENIGTKLIASNAKFYVPGRPEPLCGLNGYMEIIHMMRAGFPDIQWTLEELIAEDEKIAARFTMHGSHNGIFMGVSPTGKAITVQAMNVYTFADGKIIEERGLPDLISLLMQIGAMKV